MIKTRWKHISWLTCRSKLSWLSLILNCIWALFQFIRWQQYKGCKRAELTRFIRGFGTKLIPWKVIARDVWPACKEPDLYYTTYTICVLYRLLEIHGKELIFFFKISSPTEKWYRTVYVLFIFNISVVSRNYHHCLSPAPNVVRARRRLSFESISKLPD